MAAVGNPASHPWSIQPGAGATNLVRQNAQSFAKEILESPSYRASLKDRADRGKLSPHIEMMLWAYAYGKPIETIDVNVREHEDLKNLSIDELIARANLLGAQLEEARKIASTVEMKPGEVVDGPWTQAQTQP
jgi:hypothetical protein